MADTELEEPQPVPSCANRRAVPPSSDLLSSTGHGHNENIFDEKEGLNETGKRHYTTMNILSSILKSISNVSCRFQLKSTARMVKKLYTHSSSLQVIKLEERNGISLNRRAYASIAGSREGSCWYYTKYSRYPYPSPQKALIQSTRASHLKAAVIQQLRHR